MRLDFPYFVGTAIQICVIVDLSFGSTRRKQQVHIAPPGSNSTQFFVSGGVGIGGGTGASNSGSLPPTESPGSPDVEISIPGGGSGGPGGGFAPIVNPPGGQVGQVLDCGSTSQMYAGSQVQIFSTNFGVANYNNYESCTWKFEGNHCTLSAHCPCVEIPKSWECLGDYLRIITDSSIFGGQSQRFCGGNAPGQPIYSDSDSLNIKFRSDGKITAAGFTCFVRCEGPGMSIPLVTDIKCPSSLTFRG